LIRAQSEPAGDRPDELLSTIASLDQKLFDAYNTCDVPTFRSLLAEDLEFYHDQTGLSLGAEDAAEKLRENICGKSRRELVAGTLEVYPINGYGAVEIGVHLFYPIATDSEPTGEAKFVHLWQYDDGVWKLARVISFDHAGLTNEDRNR
jgi:hypothetical protein